jgi:hypothetical protein
MKKSRFPMKLALLPGLRWKGKLTVVQEDGAGYLVQFDAEIVDPAVSERFVFDRAVLTRQQVKDWTGVDLGEA